MSVIKLDDQQKAIVHSTAQNVLGIAGAGAGKTRVLTERVKHLLQLEVQPHNIVAITFTNMAAEEIKERLRDVPCIGDVFIGTIHSFANKIYKNSGKPYMLLTDETEQLVYEEVLQNEKYKTLSFKRWLQYMDLKHQVDMCKIDESVLNSFLLPSERNVLYTCEPDVKAIMERDNIITFDELIVFATEYFQSLGAQIEHLLVDELQDIGTAEYKFIRALNGKNYFFVGDDWQAIYGFKGGNVEIFKSLAKDPNFETYYLTNNYRSCKNIIRTGQQIIEQVQDRIEKDVNIINTGLGSVSYQSKTKTFKLVELLKNDKANWRDWFVLTRTNKEAYALADLLDDEEIDYCFIKKSDLTLEELQEAMRANQVKIMTVHASKGLENKKVILYGNFPVIQPSYMRNTDERKVMYVGVTRAQDELHIFN